jgi:hypothetical protein
MTCSARYSVPAGHRSPETPLLDGWRPTPSRARYGEWHIAIYTADMHPSCPRNPRHLAFPTSQASPGRATPSTGGFRPSGNALWLGTFVPRLREQRRRIRRLQRACRSKDTYGGACRLTLDAPRARTRRFVSAPARALKIKVGGRRQVGLATVKGTSLSTLRTCTRVALEIPVICRFRRPRCRREGPRPVLSASDRLETPCGRVGRFYCSRNLSAAGQPDTRGRVHTVVLGTFHAMPIT